MFIFSIRLAGVRDLDVDHFALHKHSARRLLAVDTFHLEVLILRSLCGSSRSPPTPQS